MQSAHILLEDLLNFSSSRVDENGVKEPRHRQIYRKIREAILNNQLESHTLLPPSRYLAKHLGISRNTIITAFDQLLAEGLIVSKQGSGTRVAAFQQETAAVETSLPVRPLPNRLQHLPPAPPADFTFNSTCLLPCLADLQLFPYKLWQGLYKQHNQQISQGLKMLDFGAGYIPLREALSQYLKISRGVSAEAGQIFITAGANQSLQLISKVLSERGDTVWLEDPCYNVAKMSLSMADLELCPVPVDNQGMAPELLSAEEKKHSPSLIYVTTSYQYPLGYTMSMSRRLELLACADKHNAWLIEDDYDGEFRYQGSAIPALAGLQNNQRTVYMGTFSKVLSPTLRMSYIVVPQSLIEPFRQAYPMLGNESSVAMQATLAEFINRGYLSRHIKRMRKIYGARRECLEYELQRFAKPNDNYNPGGLHIPLRLERDDSSLMASIIAADLGCLPLSHYYQTDKVQNGLVLGFTSVDEAQISVGMKKLEQVLDS